MAKNRNNYIHFRTCLLKPKLPTFYLLTKELTKQIEMNALPFFLELVLLKLQPVIQKKRDKISKKVWSGNKNCCIIQNHYGCKGHFLKNYLAKPYGTKNLHTSALPNSWKK